MVLNQTCSDSGFECIEVDALWWWSTEVCGHISILRHCRHLLLRQHRHCHLLLLPEVSLILYQTCSDSGFECIEVDALWWWSTEVCGCVGILGRRHHLLLHRHRHCCLLHLPEVSLILNQTCSDSGFQCIKVNALWWWSDEQVRQCCVKWFHWLWRQLSSCRCLVLVSVNSAVGCCCVVCFCIFCINGVSGRDKRGIAVVACRLRSKVQSWLVQSWLVQRQGLMVAVAVAVGLLYGVYTVGFSTREFLN